MDRSPTETTGLTSSSVDPSSDDRSERAVISEEELTEIRMADVAFGDAAELGWGEA